jgi:hypothetical protein
MVFSVLALPVGAAGTQSAASGVTAAADEPSGFLQQLYHFLDKLLNWLLSYMNFYMPKEDRISKEDYEPVEFYEGLETFDTAADADGKWSVGYASSSLIAGQSIMDGKHYMGGGLSLLEPKTCTGVTDDMKVRTFAISDGSDGIAVFAVLDAYALCSGDVIAIRELLADYAEENNIISINCSVLHQHSCIDTLGMNGELLKALVQNSATHSGLIGIHSGRNPEFMDNLHKVVAASVKNAVNDVISISGDFKLDAGGTSTYELDYSVTIDPEGSATALPASGVIATFVSPLANRSGSVELKFAADDPDYAGVYTDRLTFTLAVI